MGNFTLSLLSGSFVDSDAASDISDLQIGGNTNKEPPGGKTIDLAYLNHTGGANADNPTSSQFIHWKSIIGDLSGNAQNRTTTDVRKLSQSNDYKADYSDKIITTSEFNQI